jgi:hypothetical protein
LLLDRTHQSKLTAKLLRDLDVSVEVHKRHYLPAAPDPEWIADAANKGWAIISGDKGIEYDGVNRQAVAKSGARVFLLSDTESRGAEWAASLVMARHKIQRIAVENRGPFYCTVDKGSDHHVKDLRFLEGGGPLPKAVMVPESQAAVSESGKAPIVTDTPVDEQSAIEFPDAKD